MKNRLIRSRKVRTMLTRAMARAFMRGTSARRARARPMRAGHDAHGDQDDDRRQDLGKADVRDRHRVDGPQEPRVRRDRARSRPRSSGAWLERDEDAADRGHAQGHDRVEAAGLLDGLRQRRHQRRDAGRGDDRRDEQGGEQHRRAPARVDEDRRGDDHRRHRDEAEDHPGQRAAEHDGRRRDRSREEPVQRPVAPVREQRERAVLGREEDEHDRHRGAVERGHRGLPLLGGGLGDGDRTRAVDGVVAAARPSPGPPGRRSRRSVRTASWTAPTSAANPVTTARATSARSGCSRPGSGSRPGRPRLTASVKPGGTTIAAPARSASTLGRGGGLVGGRGDGRRCPLSATRPRTSVRRTWRQAAAVLVHDDDRRVEGRAEVGDDRREGDRQPERGQDGEQDRRPVAQALAQDPAGDDEGGAQHDSRPQSRRALPVRWRKTLSRSGSMTSTERIVTPSFETASRSRGRRRRASSTRTSMPAVGRRRPRARPGWPGAQPQRRRGRRWRRG